MSYKFEPVGVVQSCFKEKFGIPRQPGLIAEARASIKILPPYDRDEAFVGLDEFSHIWVLFIFHQCLRDTWKPTVRPPRLGGNKRVGVFASRSTHRPNSVGMSVVKLDNICRDHNGLVLSISGVDLMEGTPVIDIKPYLPYADNITGATGGYAPAAPECQQHVTFTEQAQQQ
ncbi:MAG: tRNA (N6-threonylcarbamoyladenosine(37)-N6)-methyltransferase TrmO, partial [Gammaproteobacteria bacterium]|nr:tRNA (N6-threonylcarbamoyladenosine(37)-N6)-methyltransferase TrmO [Gammaproteobacteria bacterium]